MDWKKFWFKLFVLAAFTLAALVITGLIDVPQGVPAHMVEFVKGVFGGRGISGGGSADAGGVHQ